MKTIERWILTLAVALAFSAAAGTNEPKGFVLKGTVVDAANQPVAGAAVESYAFDALNHLEGGKPKATQCVTAAADGAFELRLPSNGLHVVVRKPGLATTWCQFWGIQNDVETRLVLTPPSMLAGIVVDEKNRPVPEVEVFVDMALLKMPPERDGRTFHFLSAQLAPYVFRARTDLEGRFRIEGFPTNGGAILQVRAVGKAQCEPPRPESVTMNSMPFWAGQADIRLVVEPAGGIEGRIVVEGGAASAPRARLSLERTVFDSNAPGYVRAREPDPVESDLKGTFRIQDVPPGSYRVRAVFGTNTLPAWVAEPVSVSVESGQTLRGVVISAIRAGVLQVTVRGTSDRRPRSQVRVSGSWREYQVGDTSDRNGVAMMALPPGECQVTAYVPDVRPGGSAAVVEAGKTNQIEIGVADPVMLTGSVRRPDGTPASGVEVRLVGESVQDDSGVMTDVEGEFRMQWKTLEGDGRTYTYYVLARDPVHNLAAAAEVDEESGPLDLRLSPGLTIAGRATYDGKPVTGVIAWLTVWIGGMGTSLSGIRVSTDAAGGVEFPALPLGWHYSVGISAPGYGAKRINLAVADEAGRLDVGAVELKPANLRLSGLVLDADDKPVSGVIVELSGEDQPNGSVATDNKGRFSFKVCYGQIGIFASGQSGYANTTTTAGDTNIIIRLIRRDSERNDSLRLSALAGKPLPDLASVGLAADAAPAGTPLLLCLLDAEQRPSRRVARLLAEQTEALKGKGVTVLAAQVAATSAEAFQQWTNTSPVPFPVGYVEKKSPANKWATGVPSLPWLILRKTDGTVAAEGFALDELDAKLEALKK